MMRKWEAKRPLVVKEAMKAELYHHGILGMKWGIRRTREELGHAGEKLLKKTKMNSPAEPKQAMRHSNTNHWQYAWSDDKGRSNYASNEHFTMIAYELQRRGYDVTAGRTKNNDISDDVREHVEKAFIDPETGKPPVPKKFVATKEELDANYQTKTVSFDKYYEILNAQQAKMDAFVRSNAQKGGRYIVNAKSKREGDEPWIVTVDYSTGDGPLLIDLWEGTPKRLNSAFKNVLKNGTTITKEVEMIRVDNLEPNPEIIGRAVEKRRY